MKKFFSGFIALLAAFTLISILFSWVTEDSPESLRLEVPAVEGTELAATWVTPLSHVAGYNWFLVSAMRATKPSDWYRSYVNVDSTFFPETGNSAMLQAGQLGVLDPDMNLRLDKLEELAKYYRSHKIYSDTSGLSSLEYSVVDWLSNTEGELLQPLSVDYSSNSPRTLRAVRSQFLITAKLVSPDKNKLKTIVWNPGLVSADFRKIYGLGAKYTFIRQAALNFIREWQQAEKNTGSHFRVLLMNGNPRKQDGTLFSEDEMPLAYIPMLRLMRNTLLQMNAAMGFPLENLRTRLGFAVDMSNLVELWKNPNSVLYKNSNKEPLPLEEFSALLSRELSTQTATGQFIERPVQLIAVSFNAVQNQALLKKFPEATPGHMPFNRASSAYQVKEQLDLLTFLYRLSSMVSEATDLNPAPPFGFIATAFPRRRLLPAVHTVFRPLVQRYKEHFFIKPAGADRDEQLYTISLIKAWLSKESIKSTY